jgi:hypothetical protein
VGNIVTAFEIWRPVKGYENLYEVSNIGRVRSLPREVPHWRGGVSLRKGRIRKAPLNHDGYRVVSLKCGSHKETVSVHVLVCASFNSARPKGAVARHLDGDRLNNCADNLAWGSVQDNHNDRREHGRSFAGDRNPNAALASKDVLAIRASEEPSTVLAARFGVQRSAISKIRTGRTWKTT